MGRICVFICRHYEWGHVWLLMRVWHATNGNTEHCEIHLFVLVRVPGSDPELEQIILIFWNVLFFCWSPISYIVFITELFNQNWTCSTFLFSSHFLKMKWPAYNIICSRINTMACYPVLLLLYLVTFTNRIYLKITFCRVWYAWCTAVWCYQ